MSVNLTIDVQDLEGSKMVRLAGRLDAASAALLEKRLEEFLAQKKKAVLLDFARVDYLSSAGMRLLLSVTKKWKAMNGKILFFSMNDEVVELIKIAGFDRILGVYSNEKAALLALE